jgi:hypothetical protein
MEFAVNMPAQEPQVGQALRSKASLSSAVAFGFSATVIVSTASILSVSPAHVTLPASMAPPETNTQGMLRRSAAISIPGVILSQLEMQTIASAQCAFTMYSMLSAIRSREGSE